MIEEIRAAEGGKRGIEWFEQILIEAVHITAEGRDFPYPRISCKQQDAPSSFYVFQSGGGFFQGVGLAEVLGFDVFVKREVFEAAPGKEIFHFRILPLWNERDVGTL